jgi:hypothetical protein
LAIEGHDSTQSAELLVLCKNLDRAIVCQTGAVHLFDQCGSIENHDLAESLPLNFIGNSDTLIGCFLQNGRAKPTRIFAELKHLF